MSPVSSAAITPPTAAGPAWKLLAETREAYLNRAKFYVTAESLALFARCPWTFRQRQLLPRHEEERWGDRLGEALRSLVLEGRERYEGAYAAGARARTDADAVLVERLAASVLGHDVARELLADGAPGGVARCILEGVPCQARLDWVSPCPGRGIVALRVVDRLQSVEAELAYGGLLRELGYWRALLLKTASAALPVYLVAAEQVDPFRCGVWRIADRQLEAAAAQNARILRELAACRRTDVWPSGYEGLRVFDPGAGGARPFAERLRGARAAVARRLRSLPALCGGSLGTDAPGAAGERS